MSQVRFLPGVPNDSAELSEVKLEGVTTDVTTLREQVMRALRAFADRDETRERVAVDALARVLAYLDGAARGEKKKPASKAKKKRGTR